jgi:hypothetical protein
MMALHVPYVSVRWPGDGQKDRNMWSLKYGQLKAKYFVVFDGSYTKQVYLANFG